MRDHLFIRICSAAVLASSLLCACGSSQSPVQPDEAPAAGDSVWEQIDSADHLEDTAAGAVSESSTPSSAAFSDSSAAVTASSVSLDLQPLYTGPEAGVTVIEAGDFITDDAQVTASASETTAAPVYDAAQLQTMIDAALPGIVCWGDSITMGDAWEGGISYPNVLSDRIEKTFIQPLREAGGADTAAGFSSLRTPPVVNMGVAGESTVVIAGRDGGIPFIIDTPFTMPAGCEEVKISFSSAEEGRLTKPLILGDAGVNNVHIAGVEGVLGKYYDTVEDRSKYTFKRLTPGTAMDIPAGTPLFTDASYHYGNYIMVIMMGSNGGYEGVDDLIQQYKLMIAHQSVEKQRYVIIGMIPNEETDINKVIAEETALRAAFGPHYISLREYMVQNGLAAAGLSPTAEDQQRIAGGWIPSSILKEDKMHYTGAGYTVIGNMVFDKLDSLGYFDGLKVLN